MILKIMKILLTNSSFDDDDDDGGIDIELLRFIFFFSMIVLMIIFLYFCIREMVCRRGRQEEEFGMNNGPRTRYDTLRTDLVIKNVKERGTAVFKSQRTLDFTQGSRGNRSSSSMC